MEKILAIDPGNHGGIAIFSIVNKAIMDVVKMPETPKDLLDYLSLHKQNSICYLEKVGGLPGMGGSSMFNFGKGFGHLEMALLALQIPTVEVSPQRWQKALQLGTRGKLTKVQWKNKLKATAQRLYPDIDVTLATADALLILEYSKKELRI